jgi:predicted ATP-dependent protease
MIIGGYIADKYAQNAPLSMVARLAFEQTYEEVDGDSASSAELYCLLSRLSNSPINQGVAVTGSTNQKGEVQAIGGVNQKIEGFFYTCNAKGLTGDQGVMIPTSNTQHLMLHSDVVQAVEQGLFHIYSVSTIDEGIEILTGTAAGSIETDGSFTNQSINHKVKHQLDEMSKGMRHFFQNQDS